MKKSSAMRISPPKLPPLHRSFMGANYNRLEDAVAKSCCAADYARGTSTDSAISRAGHEEHKSIF